jgi:hypothetical protein
VPRSSREVLLLDLWGSGASTVLVDSLLGLGGSLLGVGAGNVHGVSGVLVGKTLDLLSLLVRNVVALLKLSIDDVLVLDVDEGTEVGDKGRDQSQAPERDELDEEVGDEGCEERLQEERVSYLNKCNVSGLTYSNGNIDVLSEDNTLGLDDEEVDELLNIVGHTLQRGLGNGEVLARPELRGKATAESELSDNLRCSSSTEDHVGGLEDVTDQVEVSCGEDEDDRGSEGNTGGAGVLPAQ